MDRDFLTFEIHHKNKCVQVFTDNSGSFTWLADITLKEFADILHLHLNIVDSPSFNENEKLRLLVAVWLPIDDRISGYLSGDLPENNPTEVDLSSDNR